MLDRSSKKKRPRDANQLAKLIADIATGEVEDKAKEDGRNKEAVSLGHRGGKKGGRARAESLSPERRREIAKKAAEARWAKP